MIRIRARRWFHDSPVSVITTRDNALNASIRMIYASCWLHLNHRWGTLVFVESLDTREVYADRLPKAGRIASTNLTVAVDILIIRVIVRGPA